MHRRNPAVANVEEGWKRSRMIGDKLGITDTPESTPDDDSRRNFFR